MTTNAHESGPEDRRITPADLHGVRFTRATMLRPGYVETEVDRLVSRLAEEIGRLIGEKGQLRDQVRALQAQLDGVVTPVAPSEQAVRILASAQQTADNYVAEAEEFSRQMTGEARAEYEEQVRLARETAGAIIQAAQEAAARVTGGAADGGDGARTAELEEQVAYLKAFAQACRVQLRSYLEALLTDVETEWGRADPTLLPQDVIRTPAQRSGHNGGGAPATFVANTAAEKPRTVDADVVPAEAGPKRSS
ncbi:MAG TPA: DivIVA domain-containing protein [Blastococcus sp.]|jgi:DivIVA domain-containing protein|nr:DivIVA domain-containing protein [Blastococcus sp.]